MWGTSPSIIVSGQSPSILRPAALGVAALVLVGGLAAATAAWPADAEPGDAERPAAASELRPVVKGLWPAVEAEYARAVEQGRIDETLRVLAYLDNSARAAQASSGSCSGHLECIRQCESHGDYGAVSASGAYRGAYQFDQTTWEAVGGTGDPAAAAPAEQDLRAQILYEQSGSSPWPNCG
jgi:hypothetical protein